MQEVTQKLSRNIAEFTYGFKLGDAPDRVTANAKIAILDCLGVAVRAGVDEIGGAIRSYASEAVPGGACTVWGTGLTAGPRDAAFLNGMLAHGLDYDDRVHTTTYLLATSFAATEGRGGSGARLLEAFIVGREVRFGLEPIFAARHAGVGPGARGWHANGIFGSVAAACVASKALGLDLNQTAGAIGLGAGSCGALKRDGGTMAKPFRTGHAAATGYTAAQLAKHGFTADETAIEGRFGLLEAIGPVSDQALASLGKGLGTEFSLESGIEAKLFATCAAAHEPLEAMLRLREKHRLRPEAVASIECDLRPDTALREFPKRGYEGHFSVRFCLAMGLAYGRLDADDFNDRNVQDPLIREAMKCTRHAPKSGELVVTLKDGTRLTELLKPAAKLSRWDEIEGKFRRSVDGILTADKAEGVIRSIAVLETLTTLDDLAAALRIG